MKPETKRSTATTRRRTNDGGSPFNFSSLKQAIEAIDAAKDTSINLSSLSVALSAASREMKQRKEKSHRRRETRKRDKKKKKKKDSNNNTKLVIGTKPETDAELRRWFSYFDKSFKLSLPRKVKLTSPRKLNDHNKNLKEAPICELNTDFSMNHCSESFRY
ncbi:hypothetical protein AtNW77_Chr1g0000931 [Arabidopsis thaliana]|jgi:Ni/Co efflux regulator RcnB|uniref:T1N6.23 n=3 Tax=Arabidopsis TaxID=3701 RepID=Q9LQ74_ARATH|nr:uncharacterized protein AT1G01810 [Arabidopsis thaliana]KAG7644738.1 hypothetical protein ISN45_At01g000930 [Arabidopsis thaliana x Arabidopsis arenosa]AAF78416.1 T1N6.23 [Arabidopsis thaliana]AAU44370.1 hypothetical protein AT1G01810 [Arabidopsis thaliana]AAV63840.1 hypothetical protein At1g01810 [Arabidopsis thaliana]AEE27338.1 hypothetical protein AT1G01810 [Arabidopsis thaliana]|eukprot:NP_171686.1 hypothetical protein AT1G01810 [Arabidopsis thaliana]